MVRPFIPQNNEDFQLPKVSELEKHVFNIQGVRFGVGKFGEYAIFDIVTDEKDKKPSGEYRTNAAALLNQAKQINQSIAEHNEEIRVKLSTVTGEEYNYLMFVEPE